MKSGTSRWFSGDFSRTERRGRHSSISGYTGFPSSLVQIAALKHFFGSLIINRPDGLRQGSKSDIKWFVDRFRASYSAGSPDYS